MVIIEPGLRVRRTGVLACPASNKTYSNRTTPRDFTIDTPGVTEVGTFEQLYKRLDSPHRSVGR